jgi:hypothetical protein
MDLFYGPEGWPPNVEDFLGGETGYYLYNSVTFRDEDGFDASIRALIEAQDYMAACHVLSFLATGLTDWENAGYGGLPASMVISLAMLWTLEAAGNEFETESLIPSVSAHGFINHYDQERELAAFLNSDFRSEFQFDHPVNEFLAMAIGLREYKPLSARPYSIVLAEGWDIGNKVSVNEYIGTILIDLLKLLTSGEVLSEPNCKEALFLLKNSTDDRPWYVEFLASRKTWEWIVENLNYLPDFCSSEALAHLLEGLLDDEWVPVAYRSAVGQHLNASMVQEWQNLLLAK